MKQLLRTPRPIGGGLLPDAALPGMDTPPALPPAQVFGVEALFCLLGASRLR